jgi:biotin transport system substrate-specific component
MPINKLSLIPLFAALTAAGAFIRLPLWPVPITMQTLFVLLAGLLLGPRAGALSQLVYLIVGLLGLPVFAGSSGPAVILSPSFGYLLGFVLSPVAAGSFIGQSSLTPGRCFTAALVGTLVIYAVGFPYLAFYLALVVKKPDALALAVQTGVLVFLPGDMLKCLIVAMIAPRLQLRRPPADNP